MAKNINKDLYVPRSTTFDTSNSDNASNFLPRYFKTDANKKFLHSTINQLTQPGTAKKVSGYIGRPESKSTTFDEIFVDAPTDARQNYQLEPGFVIDDTLGNTKFFKDYQDYINQLRVYGSNTTIHSRLHKQELYSWDPHINWDMFVNFQNYYWLPNGPDIITIRSTGNNDLNIETDILGKASYSFLSNGMKLKFAGNIVPATYASGIFYVEGVGTSIQLVLESNLEASTPYTTSETMLFGNELFDTTPFDDAVSYSGTPDYIIINRGSKDKNYWSRNNHWFHKDVIEFSFSYNGIPASLNQAMRAVRPIIEFEKNLKLFNFGTYAINDVSFVDQYTTDAFSFVEGSLGYAIDGVTLVHGQTVIFAADTDLLVRNNVYRVEFVDLKRQVTRTGNSKQIHLVLIASPMLNQVVIVQHGQKLQGSTFWYNGITWIKGQQKTKINQFPLFDLFDENGISFGDKSEYVGTTFEGTTIFSYKVGAGTTDSNLGFPLSYKNINNIGDIVFNFSLINDNFVYEVNGNTISKSTNVGFLVVADKNDYEYVNGWKTCIVENSQPAIQLYRNSEITNNFDITMFDDNMDSADIHVYVNNNRIKKWPSTSTTDTLFWKVVKNVSSLWQYQIIFVNKDGNTTYTDSSGNIFYVDLKTTDSVLIKVYSNLPINSNGHYEIPINLQNNPLNGVLTEFTLGEVINHVDSIVDQIYYTKFSGDFPGNGNLRDIGNVTAYGTKFVQHSGPIGLSLYHITSQSNNIINAIDKSRDDYCKFKRAFITVAEKLGVDTDPAKHVDLILNSLTKNIPPTAPYYFSDMVPFGAKTETSFIIGNYSTGIFSLAAPFNLTTLSNKAVTVYLNGVQLLHGHHYVFTDQGFVQVTTTLVVDDEVTIYEYETTDGCLIPETPTKLGMWPKYEPKKYLDTTLLTPKNVIQGHDGSLIIAYNDYRDNLILELEKRIYNNIKVEYDKEIFDVDDIIPMYNRSHDYNIEEVNLVLLSNFYKWSSYTGVDFSTPLNYDRSNSFTYLYKTEDNINTPQFWRGIYKWKLGTDRPHICPWEMLGFTEEPAWWTSVYGPAPYTSNNLILWEDIGNGLVKEPNKPVVTLTKYIRSYLITHIPVNEDGDLISPFDCNLAQSLSTSTQGDFSFGDISPIEATWRRNSHYPFSLIKTSILLTPSKTIGVLMDRSRIKRNLTGQIVYSTGVRLKISDIIFPSVYLNSTRIQTAGLINYLINYLNCDSLELYNDYHTDLQMLSAQLCYRISGFTSKEKFNLLLDSKSPTSSGSIFIPQEDYKIVLNSSSPVRVLSYSGVIITKIQGGYEIKGYSQTQPYFNYYTGSSGYDVNIGGISEGYVNWAGYQTYIAGSIVRYEQRYYQVLNTHTSSGEFDPLQVKSISSLPVYGGATAAFNRTWDRTTVHTLPYSTKLYSIQAVVDFLLGYGEWLTAQGFVFNEYIQDSAAISNWETSAKEFLFWTTQNWASSQDVYSTWEDWRPGSVYPYGSIVRYNGEYYKALYEVSSMTFDESDYFLLMYVDLTGSAVLSVSPGARTLTFNTVLCVVDSIISPNNPYELLDGNGQPIRPHVVNTFRTDNSVSYTPSTDAGIYCATFYLIQKEHVAILNNSTMFNDKIYNPESGYKQDKIKVSGYVSAEWNGSLNVPGFVVDQAKINDWMPWKEYALGDVVKYRSFYYTSVQFVQGTQDFDDSVWVKLSNKPTPRLLPNWNYKATQFTDFYSLESENFDVGQQKMAQHLTGYQKRQYLENIIQDDVSEFKFYQGMIIEKGTQNVLNKLFDVLSADGQESLKFYEEWAIRAGQYGASSAFENIEFILDESRFKSNPQGFELVNSVENINDLIIRQTSTDIYVRPANYTPNIWPAAASIENTSTYFRTDEVTKSIKSVELFLTEDISTYSFGDYISCTFAENDLWNVYQYISTSLTVNDVVQTDTGLKFTVDSPIMFTLGSYIGIKSDSPRLYGFFKVSAASINTFEITSDTVALPSNFSLISISILQSRRVDTIDNSNYKFKDVNNGSLLWTNTSLEHWKTWKYESVYSKKSIDINDPKITEFGQNIATNRLGNILITSAILNKENTHLGEVLMYVKDSATLPWVLRQVITNPFFNTTIPVNDESAIGKAVALSEDGVWLAIGSPVAGSLIEQGVVSIYKRDVNSNMFVLDRNILSLVPTAYERFGSTLVFNNNVLLVGTTSGKVYKLMFKLTVNAEELYNPNGSSNNTLVVGSTQGILPGMFVHGTGFTNSQFVTEVVNSTTVRLSDSPSERPNGTIKFISYKWTVTTNTLTETGATIRYGNSIAVSNNGMLVISDPYVLDTITGNPVNGSGKVYIYSQDAEQVYYKVGTITAPSDAMHFGKSVAISKNADFIAVSNLHNDLTYDGKVYIYKVGHYTSPVQILLNVSSDISGIFGDKISFANDYKTLVISSSFKLMMFDGGTTSFNKNGVTGFLGNITVNPSGVVDIFDMYESKWIFSERLTPTLDSSDQYGKGLVVTPTSIVVTAPGVSTVPRKFNADLSINYDTNRITINSHGFTNRDAVIYNSGIRTTIPGLSQDATYYVKIINSNIIELYTTPQLTTIINLVAPSNQTVLGIQTLTVRLLSGKLYEYVKPINTFSWSVKNYSITRPDVKKIKQAFLYNRLTNKLIKYLDVIDSIHGKHPKIAEREVKFKSAYDPAVYSLGSISEVNVDSGIAWGVEQVGALWWDLRTTIFVDSYTDDVVYRNSTTSMLAPGASVDIYEWIETSLLPSEWDADADTNAGLTAGISGLSLYGDSAYTEIKRYDTVGRRFKSTYYYWVKNKTTIPAIVGRNMSAYDVSNLIANPKGEGYEFLAITGLNSFSLINVAHLLSHTDVVLSVEYWVVDNINQNIHTEWKLISEAPSSVVPNNVEQKWIDSLCGKDLADRIVPDKLLPIKLRYGIENRPRQGMFVNRFEALKQYIEETNLILKKYLIVNIRNLSNLEQFDKLPTENQGLTDVTVDTYTELQFESANYYLKPALRPIIINGGITGIIIDFPGKGYANAPYINVHGNGRNAKIRAVIDTLGQIVGCEVLNKGEGYTNSTVLTVRSYSALVVSDEYSNNLWCIYAYEPLTDKWSKIRSQTYDVTKYWSKIDWYAPNYSKFTAINYAVDTYTDLNTLTTVIGEIVKIRITSSNSWVLLEKYANSTSYDWTESYKVVGSENGTIKFSSLLYSFINTAVGYDGMLYDTGVYDNCAGIEIRIILNAIKNDLLIDDLSSEYLKLFFTSVRYAMSEQTYIDWIFKTSFVNVTHNVGMLHRSTTYRNDNLSNFEDYVSEVKPYRTQVREYVSSYSNIEQGATAVSDFDMPPVYDHVYNSLMMINTKTLGDIIEVDNASVNLYPWKAWYDNVGFSITRLDLYDNGSGYVSEPKVTIVSDSGSGATARAFISSGRVSRIKLLTPGEGYLTTPTVIITGGVSTGGTPARASVQLGNSVVRSNLIKIKFDRITQTMLVTDLLHTDTLTNVTGTKLQFSLSWAPDLRIGKTTVRVNGSIIIRDNYKLQVVTSNLGKYSGFITFNTAPKANSIITVTYLKNVALLNAVDRIEHYYSPQVGDIGKDLAQLMSGIDYGGVVVSGLNFNVSSGWGMTGFSTAKWDSTSSISNYKVTIPKDEYRIQLPYVPEIGTKLNVYYDNGSGALPIRIDDPTFTLVGTNENVNAIMVTPIATGIDNIVEIPKWFTSENDSYTFIIRNENSDGSEETSDYDVSLNGGTFEYLSASGLLAEDLILDGDKFDSTFSGPEEVVPGQVVDTFAIKVYTRDNSGAFMQFKDMLNRVSYKRLSAEKQTTLVKALKYNDITIVISDASNFETPDPLVNIPGVVYINGERIEFFTLSGSVLGQLRRGTLGTGIPLVHAAGSYVQELGTTETVPYIESTNTYQATIADGTVIVKTASDRLYGESIIVVLPFVPKKSKVVWDYRVSIPTGYGQCDDVEVYIGGYNYGSTWVSNAEYYINDVVTYGSYIYKCVADHISTTFTADFNTDIIKSKWTFFIGNIRLQKNPYTVYNERYVSLSNPTGEKRFPADYSVNGKYKEVRISNTFSLAQNTVITVVKKTGNIWTSNGPEMSFINAVSQAVI